MSIEQDMSKNQKKILKTTEKTSLSTRKDEITIYLLMPIVRENKNPLDW